MTASNRFPSSERPLPFRLRPHSPVPPLWFCSGCSGRPWPCPAARLLLRAEFDQAPVGLAIYMAALLMDAMKDLYRLDPQPEPDTRILFRRFVGWVARNPV